MPEFDFKELQPLFFIIIGLVLVLVALLKKASKSHLKQSGLKAEGIIFQLEKASNSNINSKVTVRFVTRNKEWITGEINQDFAVFFTGQYKEGQRIDVYYDPKKPSQFFVDTKQSETLSKVVFAVVGLGFSLIGLYQLLIK